MKRQVRTHAILDPLAVCKMPEASHQLVFINTQTEISKMRKQRNLVKNLEVEIFRVCSGGEHL